MAKHTRLACSCILPLTSSQVLALEKENELLKKRKARQKAPVGSIGQPKVKSDKRRMRGTSLDEVILSSKLQSNNQGDQRRVRGTSLDEVSITVESSQNGVAQQMSGRGEVSRESNNFEEVLKAQFKNNQLGTELGPTLEGSAE